MPPREVSSEGRLGRSITCPARDRTQAHGTFDYNQTPLAPPGCKIAIHDRAGERRTWAEHASRGFYVGPAMDYYRYYQCDTNLQFQNKLLLLFLIECSQNNCQNKTNQVTSAHPHVKRKRQRKRQLLLSSPVATQTI